MNKLQFVMYLIEYNLNTSISPSRLKTLKKLLNPIGIQFTNFYKKYSFDPDVNCESIDDFKLVLWRHLIFSSK